MPGGAIEPGESAAEACDREVFEELGLRVRVKRLLGIYSYPDQLVSYTDGAKFQIVALHCETAVIKHKERIMDTLANENKALIR